MSSRPSSRKGWPALAALLVLSSCAGTTGTGSAPSADAARLVEIDDPLAALESTAAALAADPADTDAWFLRARAFEAAGQADSALAAYDTLRDLDPDDPQVLVLHGLALEQADRHDEALAAYTRATELAPGDAVPWINLGSIQYFHYKRTWEAKEALTRAIAIDPLNPDARFNLGVLFADAGMFREADVEWQRVVDHSPPGPARNLAIENLERIRPLVEEAESLHPGD